MKASCGGYAGGRCPYGYKVVGGRLVINEEEKPIVLFVFRELKKGTPRLTIAEMLNDAGFRTRNGKHFYDSSVRSIAENERTYRGMYKYGNDMDWVKGVHEPILTDDDGSEA